MGTSRRANPWPGARLAVLGLVLRRESNRFTHSVRIPLSAQSTQALQFAGSNYWVGRVFPPGGGGIVLAGATPGGMLGFDQLGQTLPVAG